MKSQPLLPGCFQIQMLPGCFQIQIQIQMLPDCFQIQRQIQMLPAVFKYKYKYKCNCCQLGLTFEKTDGKYFKVLKSENTHELLETYSVTWLNRNYLLIAIMILQLCLSATSINIYLDNVINNKSTSEHLPFDWLTQKHFFLIHCPVLCY